jgi:hypothetical protein
VVGDLVGLPTLLTLKADHAISSPRVVHNLLKGITDKRYGIILKRFIGATKNWMGASCACSGVKGSVMAAAMIIISV